MPTIASPDRIGRTGAPAGAVRPVRSCWPALLLALAPVAPLAAQDAGEPAPAAAPAPASALQREVEAPRLPGMRWADVSDARAQVRRLYQPGGYGPRWTQDGRPTAALRAMVQRFLAAGSHGLVPADYDAAAHDSVLARLEAGDTLGEAALAAYEARVSASAVRYTAAMRHGRVRLSWKEDTLMARRPAADMAPFLDSLLQSPEPAALLAGLDAHGAAYPRLQAALAAARLVAADSTLALPAIVAPLRPGAPLPAAAELRRFLLALDPGVPDSATPEPGLDTLYDAPLVARVRAFQRAEGLKPDGVLGRETLARLARAPAWRVRQLEIALDRLRVLPPPPDSIHVRVNIPEYRLHVLEPSLVGMREALAMNVVVGGLGRNETPEFVDEIETIVFRPYWNITPRIMRDEIKPGFAQDSTYLSSRGMELVQRGKVIPTTPENVALIGTEGVRVRQRPGAQNALGKVKFLLPNDYGVYLHDTPTRATFQRERRAESHGCIRLEDAKAFAEWLLRDQPDWTSARIDSAMAAEKPTDVRLTARVPVRLEYATVVAGDDGTLQRFPDVYGRDRVLDRLLALGYPLPSRPTPVRAILKKD
jgi:murein L,D-transpeptidase YcbB/YkuD